MPQREQGKQRRVWSPLYWATILCATISTAFAAPVSGVFSDSPVAQAAKSGDVEEVRSLIKAGADVNTPLGDGMTALHWAARNGNLELARFLIQEAKANLGMRTRIGEHTPLHVASAAGRASVVKVLVEAGSNVNTVTTTGATSLHFAAASGIADTVAILLQQGAKVNPREPQWGQTPLMFAAAANRPEVIAVLLKLGADPAITAKVVDIVARDKEDSTDLRRRNRRIAEIRAATMGKKGTSPSKQEDRYEVQRGGGEPVPLNYAGLIGTHGGLTALLLAAREGHTEATLALIEGGADINQVSAADHTSPMLIAMINGHFDLAMLHFEQGADPTLASDAGATPLYASLNMHWAPKARHPQPVDYQQQETTYLEVMKTLLKAGVDPNTRLKRTLWYTTYNRDLLGVDRAGASPFWRAAYALDLKAMRLLLHYGADPSIPTMKVPGRIRRGKDYSGLPSIPLGGPAVYPIHAASGVGYGLGYAGNSHRHVPNGWLPAVKFLVEELGAGVNARDHDGYTPLHHAASRGDNEMIFYLVEKGADVTAVSRSGQTTADMANGPVQRIQPFPETVRLLERLGSKNNHKCVSC